MIRTNTRVYKRCLARRAHRRVAKIALRLGRRIPDFREVASNRDVR